MERKFPSTVTTAAYIILCDGERTVVLEKDRASAVNLASDEFVVATNHDVADEGGDRNPPVATDKSKALQVTGMDTLVEESIDRKKKICQMRTKTLQRRQRTRTRRQREESKRIRRQDVISWMNAYPITNEETHFATIMDPKTGDITWIQRFIESPFHET